ncbi:DNA helicase MCM8 [Nematocida homosporus]|uniref:DNA helicase MCM8 n=1 Tax=Nematocida homosporus TaxID=1912981 RepID=UPI002220A643|nr:DNA helicase MCM8 [Nematocida homosporus]KAI5185296.1 DNA helicase MCM8 [Nematocida homosporus]
MEYRRLYFGADAVVDDELLDRFYNSMVHKLDSEEISLKEIEEDLIVDSCYLESHLVELNKDGLDHLRCALSRILWERRGVIQRTFIKITGFADPLPFTALRHALVGKVFSLAGVVARIENAKPEAVAVVFACSKCGEKIETFLKSGGVYEKPARCVDGCRSKSFVLLKDSLQNTFSDFQRVRLHEICLDEGTKRKAGTIQCILTRSLINTLLPGDAIHLVGVGIAEESAPDKYIIAVAANNYTFLKPRDNLQEASNFPEAVIAELKGLANTHSNILELLSDSLFREIVGHQSVKEGILLSLVGGAAHKSLNKRKEIHTLIVGDPGMGKSKLLRMAAGILPRSNYVCSTTSTPGGLGVSIHSQPGGEYSLEAGALVLSDLGHCFVDELDKLDTPEVLLEAMEQASISIAKAGMVCTMPCRAGVLAAANPILGKYAEDRSVAANLSSFAEAFLSRFDLVFLLIDTNTQIDQQITRHFFQAEDNQTQPTIPEDLAKQYLQYAREHIQPILSSSAKSLLMHFYQEIKTTGTYEGKTIPHGVTPRTVETLMRVAEARAKLSLRVIATKADMEYAISISTMRPHTPTTTNRKSNSSSLLPLLTTLPQPFTYRQIHQAAQPLNLSSVKIDQLIAALNDTGLILKTGPQHYIIPANTNP